MSVQVGTVDGLINITPVIKDCFVEAINSFSNNVIKNNKLGDLSIGDAFQRYTYPVYSGQETEFKIESLKTEVTTKTGNKQSPAFVTYCKKMGLLETDGTDSFDLTIVGSALLEGQIELHEYAMLYMSKQGIFIDGQYKENLLVHIANLFKLSPSITTDELLQSIATKYGDSNFQKTRSDIILGALCAAKILSKVNNVYVLAGIAQAQILDIFALNGENIRPAVLDKDQTYADYVGTFKYGLYDFLNEKNRSSFAYLYPNLITHLQENYTPGSPSLPLQQIFYGAPGTGKSCGIKKIIKEHNIDEKTQVIRTTFHPDSDYSTFVGAYKPTMEKQISKIYSDDQLIAILEEIKSQGITYPCHKFGAKYWESLRNLSEKSIKDLAIAVYGADTTMDQEIRKGMNVGEELLRNQKESKIVYTFVPQAFLKAYVAAWKNNEKEQKVFLVIEEINRGNCAQIFGDIFQLLDRNDNGESEYPIKADQDIQNYLAEAFADCNNLPKNIKSGEELVLPNNLYIWATMNTSDQSLFPIDSAFKRRWDWEYVPIKYANGNWVIEIGDLRYSWVSFQKIVNKKVYEINHSEDKMLGDFFVKANDQDVISEKVLINKILFYLWNDVCKDGEGDIFKKDEKTDLTFSDLYGSNGTTNLIAMMDYLGVEQIEDDDMDENEETNSATPGGKGKHPKYSIDGSTEVYSTPKSVLKIINDFAQKNLNMSVPDMITTWNRIANRNEFLIESWEPSPTDNSNPKRRTEITWNGKSVWVERGWTGELFQTFIENVKKELGIDIVKVN